jgi:hypothetical protein
MPWGRIGNYLNTRRMSDKGVPEIGSRDGGRDKGEVARGCGPDIVEWPDIERGVEWRPSMSIE